ncbi:hypothetical protein H2248_003443 [Termitomyces sp. 'cryptogamus']|nr:hypothetical protein H2248_003443 [Termitomyces sp. 'cryptogamus']
MLNYTDYLGDKENGNGIYPFVEGGGQESAATYTPNEIHDGRGGRSSERVAAKAATPEGSAPYNRETTKEWKENSIPPIHDQRTTTAIQAGQSNGEDAGCTAGGDLEEQEQEENDEEEGVSLNTSDFDIVTPNLDQIVQRIPQWG